MGLCGRCGLGLRMGHLFAADPAGGGFSHSGRRRFRAGIWPLVAGLPRALGTGG